MTIAYYQDELIGVRHYIPEGPYGAATNFQSPNFKFGDIVGGDAESEFVFLQLGVTAAGMVLNQGDALCWDNSYFAVQTGAISAALQYPVGTSMGVFFCGGRVGDPAAHPAAGSIWSYTFPTVGIYGVWVQRCGTALLKTGTITTQATGANTRSVTALTDPSAISFSAGSVHSNPVQNINTCLTSLAFTANTLTGSAVLSAVSTNQFLVKGQTLSGAGIPAGTVISDIQGSTVTMSLVATATASGVAVTAANGSTFATTTNLSAVLTNVTSIAGLYPNQIVTGTGIAAGSTILKIEGNQAPYKVTLSLAATATANNINVTVAAPTNAAPNYLEAFLRWPQFSGATT